MLLTALLGLPSTEVPLLTRYKVKKETLSDKEFLGLWSQRLVYRLEAVVKKATRNFHESDEF